MSLETEDSLHRKILYYDARPGKNRFGSQIVPNNADLTNLYLFRGDIHLVFIQKQPEACTPEYLLSQGLFDLDALVASYNSILLDGTPDFVKLLQPEAVLHNQPIPTSTHTQTRLLG